MTVDQSSVNLLDHMPMPVKELKKGSGEYHGACPVCSSDHDGFMVWPAKGNYWCRTCNSAGDALQFIIWSQGKTFLEALSILGLEDNQNGNKDNKPATKDRPRTHIANSEIAYQSRAHYAAVKGIPESVLINAKFGEVEDYQGRPAMKYPTYDSEQNEWWRWRFMDGDSSKAKYKPAWVGEGVVVPPVWYRLSQALGRSNKQEKAVVIVNGESSVLVAQHYNVPAICKTGGEMALPDNLIAELVKIYPPSRRREVIIALDCDEKGRKAAKDIAAQLTKAEYKPVVVDLGLSDTGDFADYCSIHSQNPLKSLFELVEALEPVSYNVKNAGKELKLAITNKVAPKGRIIMMPFAPLAALGGDARFMQAGRMTIVGGPSGHFKTAFWGTMVDDFLPRGLSGICAAQEFEAQTYRLRRIARFSGRKIKGSDGKDVTLTPVTYDEITEYGMHLQEIENEVPSSMRQAKNPFTGKSAAAKLDTINRVDKMVKGWRGHLEYVPPGMMFLEDRIAFMTEWVQKRRASGETVDFAIFDYIQLMKTCTAPKGVILYQWMVSLMKQFAIEMNLHVIAMSQVNKQPSNEMKTANRRMGVGDLAWINDNDANLTIILNFYYVPQLDKFGNKKVDINGQDIIGRKTLDPSGYTAAVVDVHKNSHGDPAPVRMPVDAKHLRWVNSIWR